MANTIIGKVLVIGRTEEIPSKNGGQPFLKRTLVQDCSRYDQYTGKKFENYPQLEFASKNTAILDNFARKRTNKRGYEVEYLRSSRDLDTQEMTTAIERFRNYSSAECGLYLPAPHEGESLFFAQQQIEQFKEYL